MSQLIRTTMPPCLSGFIDNLRGMARIWKRVTQPDIGMTTLKLRRLNQDDLENWFGQIRAACGSNTDPSVTQYVGAMKTVLIQQLSASVRDSNCSSEKQNPILLRGYDGEEAEPVVSASSLP